MSQESDTPKDSKPVRLKLSAKDPSKTSPKTVSGADATPPPSTKEQSTSSSEKKPISFKKRPETETSSAPTPNKKQVPLKPKAQLKPKTETRPEPAPEEPELQSKPLGLKPKANPEANIPTPPPIPEEYTLNTVSDPTPESSPEVPDPSQSPQDGLQLKQDVVPNTAPEEPKEAPSKKEPKVKKEKSAAGKKTLILSLLIILVLGAVAVGALVLIFKSLGGPEAVTAEASPKQPTTLEKEPTNPQPEPKGQSLPTATTVIAQAKDAVSQINAINQEASDMLNEDGVKANAQGTNESGTTNVSESDLVTDKAEPKIISVASEEVTSTRTVVKVGADQKANSPQVPAEPEPSEAQKRAELAKKIDKDPTATLWVQELRIPSHSEAMQKATLGGNVYRKGDLVNEDLQLSLFHVTAKAIYFEDMRGAIYTKQLR